MIIPSMLGNDLRKVSRTFLSPLQTQPVIGAIGGATLGSIHSPVWAIGGAVCGFIVMLFLAFYERIDEVIKEHLQEVKEDKGPVQIEDEKIQAVTNSVISVLSDRLREDRERQRQQIASLTGAVEKAQEMSADLPSQVVHILEKQRKETAALVTTLVRNTISEIEQKKSRERTKIFDSHGKQVEHIQPLHDHGYQYVATSNINELSIPSLIGAWTDIYDAQPQYSPTQENSEEDSTLVRAKLE